VPAALDTALLRLLRAHGHSPRVERAVSAFSKLGEHAAIWLGLAAAGAALDRRRRDEFVRAGRTVVLSYVVNQAIKQTVRRPRPDIEGLPQLVGTPTQLSYPSTHACTSFAGAGALSGLLPAAPLYVLAVPLALSRLYLGVHYPSDTLAGGVVGAAVAELAR
jgi:membrane-associated phospholipid phosphatase